MPTCRDIITRALRKLNAVALGDNASTGEAENALSVLVSLYQEMIAWGAFGRLYDALVSSDITAVEQMRACCATDAITVTLPTQVPAYWDCGYGANVYPYADGYEGSPWWGPLAATVDRNLRPPRDGALIEVVKPGGTHSFMFDAQVQRWTDLTGLQLTDAAPLAGRYAEPIANVLAGRLATDYGDSVSPALQVAMRNGLSLLSHRYDRPRQAAVASYF